ncbi:MAG: type II toxin-antitoxin system MqsA family antitoxin [Candidatus Nitrotoga sp.]
MKTKGIINLCDACCEGHLHSTMRNEKCEYKGTHGQLAIHFSACDICKAEILDASDLLENKREWVRFKKKVDHIPLGGEIANMRKEHHLSQSLAASIFGGGPVAFSKYENDDLIPDESMVNLLKLAIAHPDTVRRLAKLKGVVFEYTNLTWKAIGAKVIILSEQIRNPAYIDLTKYVRNDSVYLPRNSLGSLAYEKQLPMSEASCSAIDILRPIASTTEFRATSAVDAAISVVCKIQDADPTSNAEFTSTPTFGNFKLEADSITLGTC